MKPLRRWSTAFLLSLSACQSTESPIPAEVTQADRMPSPPSPPPAPADPKTLDLTTALRLAAGGHLDVLEARARVREAEGRASSADGFLLPVLSVGGSIGGVNGQALNAFGVVRNAHFYAVNSLGTIRISANVGEAVYRDLAAHRTVEAAVGFEQAQLQRTLLDVSVGYLALVESDGTVRIQEQFVQESQTLARLTQARAAQGLGSALDAERAQAQAAAAEQRLLGARNERQRRSKALAAALRLDATVDLQPADRDLSPASLVNPAEDLKTWLERAADRRQEVFALQQTREAATDEASAVRWSVWGPEVSAGASFGVLGKSFSTMDERYSWLVAAGWTFSLGGPGRIEAADARLEQAAIALRRFQDRLQASVAGAYQELLLARQQMDPSQRELTAAENALRIAKANYEGGVLPETDLLLTQQAADQARLRRLSAVARFNQSQLLLLAESGTASIDTLTRGVSQK